MGVFQNNLMGAAAAAASAGGGDFYDHQIANSIRNSAAQNGNLTFTAGTPSSSTTFTMSYWVKRYTNGTAGDDTNLFVTGTGGASYAFMAFGGNAWQFQPYGGSWGAAGGITMNTTALYRDISSWYHHVIIWDTTQSTQADRVKMYVNGERITSFSTEGVTGQLTLNESLSYINQSGVVQAFGGLSGKGHGTVGADLQMAEIVFNDGQAYGPENYGETKNGVWIPKDPSGLTFGNNGYYLKFESSGDLGNDSSGNNNDFTVANISAHDQMLDSPTFNSDSNGGNYCTMNPLNSGSNNTFSEGNLKVTNSSGGCTALGTMSLVTGHKWYFEGKCTGSGNNWIGIIEENGYTNSANTNSSIAGSASFNTYLYGHNGLIYYGSSSTSTGATFTTGDIMGVLVDLESGTNTIQFYKNGTAQGSAFNLTGTGINYTPMSDRGSGSGDGFWFNFGQEGTFGTGSGGGNSDATGYGSFYYDDGASAKALCTGNLPTADAIDPAQTSDDFPQKLFQPLTYTGTGSSGSITTEFQPDFIWMKNRGTTKRHYVVDSNRGINSTSPYLHPDSDVSEGTGNSTGVSGVSSTSISFGGGLDYVNASSNTYVSWHWRSNGGTTAANSVGGTDSVTQVDPSKALSIVTYTGISGSSGSSTVGHGMGVVPQLIFHKARNASGGWWTQFASSTDANYFLELNGTRAQTELAAGTYGAMSRPTTSVFSINGVDGVGGESRNYVAYCFANIEGYCKVGSFVGNGNTDGPFIYTGFRPSLVVRKRFDGSGSWLVKDDARNPTNDGSIEVLTWNSDGAENPQTETSDGVDFLSNGFKLKATNNGSNGDGLTYVYLAISFNPFKYSTAF